ncbi:MAG: hypothetical protein PVJ60_02895 [Phycisphaerales bacterium]|jgi:cell division protein FtsB
MKTLTRTIILLVIVNLIITSMAIAQDSYGEQVDVTQVAAQARGETQPMSKEAERRKMEADIKRIQDELAKLESEKKRTEIASEEVNLMLPQQISGTNIAIGTGTSRVRIPSLRSSSSEAVLVIPTAEMGLEDLASITEDMTVMSRIFNKKLSQSIERRFYGGMYGDMQYPFVGFGRGSGTIKTIYLEGYGALFMMKVDFPLVQPPVEQEEEETEEEDADPVWTQTTQEIYAPQEINRRRRIDRTDVEEYDAEKVEELKETLIKTLKHAKNIRALKADESVILTVVGRNIQSDTIVTRMYETIGNTIVSTVPEGANTDISSPTILTIRAKKSDIDAYANDELSFEQFSRQIQVLTYSLLGESGGSRPSSTSPYAPMMGRTRSSRGERVPRSRSSSSTRRSQR